MTQFITSRFWHARAIAIVFATLFAFTLSISTFQDKSAIAQNLETEVWEYSPYRVKVLVGYGSHPVFNSAFHNRVAQEVTTMANLIDRSGWRISVNPAPREWAYPIAMNLDSFDFNETERESDLIKNGDKIILVGINQRNNIYTIRAKEFDCFTDIWGQTVEKMVYDYADLQYEVIDMIKEAFTAVGKITLMEDKELKILPRAGGLVKYGGGFGSEMTVNADSPVWISKESILVPVERRIKKSRDKETKKQIFTKTVKVIDWTYVTPSELDLTNEPIISATMYSAMRAPLGGRTNTRAQKLVRVAKARGKKTTLYLTDRATPPAALQGYDIYSVRPGEKNSLHLGKTDWSGAIEILPDDDAPFRLIYVKSGRRKLARLPIVPGLFEEVTGKMFDDAIRIRADGYAKAMRITLLDLLTRRQTLAIRIRNQIQNDQLDTASNLLENLTSLQDEAAAFEVDLNRSRRRLESKDSREQKHVDRIFRELLTLSKKHLTTTLITQVQKEYDNARKGIKTEIDDKDFGKP